MGDRAERFVRFGLPVLPDIYPGSALGGSIPGFFTLKRSTFFVSSCDLPFPNIDILFFLCSLRRGFDAVVPNTTQGFEPLFAVYAKTCLGPMRDLLESGNRCVFDFYPQVRVRYLQGEELAHLDRDGRSFLNINSPEEFEQIRKEGRP